MAAGGIAATAPAATARRGAHARAQAPMGMAVTKAMPAVGPYPAAPARQSGASRAAPGFRRPPACGPCASRAACAPAACCPAGPRTDAPPKARSPPPRRPPQTPGGAAAPPTRNSQPPAAAPRCSGSAPPGTPHRPERSRRAAWRSLALRRGAMQAHAQYQRPKLLAAAMEVPVVMPSAPARTTAQP